MTLRPLTARDAGPLRGAVTVPGDKSMSHRALILGAMAVGRTKITGLLDGDDVRSTAGALRAMGVSIEAVPDGGWTVDGVGVGGLDEPSEVLDLGNSGTGARLLMGLVATHPITTIFTGDASLVKRPMARVTAPLERMGARFVGRRGGLLPMAVIGSAEPMPIEYRTPVASAQVKSAVLLAGLNTPGRVTLIEAPTRDHTERMLRHFGAAVAVEELPDGSRKITLDGQPELTAAALDIHADPSSAAFPLVAALIAAGSEVRLGHVGLNPLRTGLFATLREMGADLTIENAHDSGGEPVGDLIARGSALRGVVVPAERAPSMIDEYPILAVAAAFAQGRTVMHGLDELRVKESDRLAAIAEGLTAAGVDARIDGSSLIVEGGGGRPVPGGATIRARLDHRIAMAFLILGLRAARPITIDDGATIDTSFPGFVGLMRGLGADIAEA